MNPFVLNTVIKDSWNATGKYYSVAVMPARVSKSGGIPHVTKVAGRCVSPPPTTMLQPFFNYYQMGDIEPYLFGAYKYIKNMWVSCEDLMNDNELFINVSLDNGSVISPKDCWLIRAGVDRNWILAVYENPMYNYGSRNNTFLRQEENDNLILNEDGSRFILYGYGLIDNSLALSKLFIKFYVNPAYHKGHNREGVSKLVNYKCSNPGTLSKVNQFLNSFPDNISTGWVLFNGKISTLAYAKNNAQNLVQKEVAVYVDSTIKLKKWFKLITTPTHKLHNGLGYTLRVSTTTFFDIDNMEVFIGTGYGSNFVGSSLDFNISDNIYQISKTEIGISLSTIEYITSLLTGGDDVYLYVVIRENHDLSPRNNKFNSSRVDLLDSLDFSDRDDIYAGAYPELDHWIVGNIIDHPSMVLMRSKVEDIDTKMVLDAYGYSGVNRLFNPYPIAPTSLERDGVNYQVFRSGIALREKTYLNYPDYKIYASVYDVNGRYMTSREFNQDIAGYVSFNDIPQAKLADLSLCKTVTNDLKLNRKLAGDFTVDGDIAAFGYACYVADINNDSVWELAEKGYHYNVDESGGSHVVEWNNTTLTNDGLIGRYSIGDTIVNHIVQAGNTKNGRDYCTIQIDNDSDGDIGIPQAMIDIYNGGRLLVPGFEYAVIGDRIFLFSLADDTDELRIICSGLSPSGSFLKPIDIGYTDEGRVGLGNVCREISFRQLQINIDGSLYTEEEINLGTSSIIDNSIGSGKIYGVRQRVASIEGYMGYSSMDSMLEENSLSTVLHDGLDALFPIDDSRSVDSITDDLKHIVMSCFINEILYQLKQGWKSTEISNPYTKPMVDTWIDPFSDILAADVCFVPEVDLNFMIIVPHDELQRTVTQDELNFLKFINDNYLDGKVRVNGYFTL